MEGYRVRGGPVWAMMTMSLNIKYLQGNNELMMMAVMTMVMMMITMMMTMMMMLMMQMMTTMMAMVMVMKPKYAGRSRT